ncbi:acyl dehydratase [Agaricicola taiwanensis]|uniref:Acyl dehydratase n=1 Tax=Agaricicola taiwanensis TaxID=591372 RepID=A0A8J2VSA2_9RHOB|nr:MaoC family dehydratase [Agaricicola taiwanensis]GGE40067.1 acyl dehydratase [Agaricicola taiwanensis]
MFLEEFHPGDRVILGNYHFTAEDIITFASAHDPQPFHIDPEAAKRSHFKGLIASGWHTAAIWMRLNVEYMQELAAMRAAKGEAMGRLGPSPGFTNMRWTKPVRPGDVLTYGVEVLEVRRSERRPGWGILHHRGFATNQDNEEIFSFFGKVFVESRG